MQSSQSNSSQATLLASSIEESFLEYDGPESESGYPLQPHGYIIIEEIGRGAFAKVLRAFCPSKMEQVAIKVIALEALQSSMEEIQAEVRAMASICHEHVLSLHCCFVVRSELWLIMPLMSSGSVTDVMRVIRSSLNTPPGQGLPHQIVRIILRRLLKGLSYIHENGQIHRDIKAGNILMNRSGRLAIADFGVSGWKRDPFSRKTGESMGERKTFVGTPCWMAPEVMEQTKGYDEKADIWSVGITALELAKGSAPYAKLAPMQVLLKTIREPPPNIHSYNDGRDINFPDSFHDFVDKCLQRDPTKRPAASELLKHPFLVICPEDEEFFDQTFATIPQMAAKMQGKSEVADPLSSENIENVIDKYNRISNNESLEKDEHQSWNRALNTVKALIDLRVSPMNSVSAAPNNPFSADPSGLSSLLDRPTVPGTTWVFPDEFTSHIRSPMRLEPFADTDETNYADLEAELQNVGEYQFADDNC